jgi:hypothetical protein
MSTVPEGDLEAAVAARKELGREREPELVEAFLDRIEQGIDKRIDERLSQQRRTVLPPHAHELTLRLPLGSIALGIGATAVANGMGGAGIAVAIVAWIAIAIVNLAYFLRQ